MRNPVKRKILYIDAALQNRLLLAFLLLEILLIGGGMIVMYLELKSVVEDNLFRIHFAASEPLSSLLIWKAMRILAALVILNVAALGLAEWLWSRQLNSILRPLSKLLDRTAKLDLTSDDAVKQHHAVLAHTKAWRDSERQRCKQLHTIITSLDDNADYSSATTLDQTRTKLETLKTLLPRIRN